jgi:hypothetical protein
VRKLAIEVLAGAHSPAGLNDTTLVPSSVVFIRLPSPSDTGSSVSIVPPRSTTSGRNTALCLFRVFPHFSKLWVQVQQGEQERMEVRSVCGSVDQQAPRGETMSDKVVIIMLISSQAFMAEVGKKKEK